MWEINAQGVYYQDLNEEICTACRQGHNDIKVINVNGQRYIGAGLPDQTNLILEGTPGNDLAAYLDGTMMRIFGNVQDGVANTMNAGEIVIHGHTGDTLGYAMRGGRIFVRDFAGYRVGIHLKEYLDKVPAIVIGGIAGDFLGEYMAGGVLIVLGLNREPNTPIVGNYCGTGMHGGVMYLRGEVASHQLGKEVKAMPLDDQDHSLLRQLVKQYCEYFGTSIDEIMQVPFAKLIPFNKRPYGNLYAGW
jgi:glutamate synthase domain-containing protein 3